MTATERQLRATNHFNKSTSRIGQCNKVAGYKRYVPKVGDGDYYTNLWKMLQSASVKLAKRDFAVIPLDLQTPVSMPPAIDPNMVLLMNAKEGQPAYWRRGPNGLEFVRWAAPLQTPDSRFEAAKDRLIVKVAESKNFEERLASMEEQLQQRTTEKSGLVELLRKRTDEKSAVEEHLRKRTAEKTVVEERLQRTTAEKTAVEERLQRRTVEKTAVADQLRAVQEQHQRDVNAFQAEKASLQSRIDAMWRQTTGTSRNVGGQASGLGVRKPFAPPAPKSRAFSSYPRVVGTGFVYQ